LQHTQQKKKKEREGVGARGEAREGKGRDNGKAGGRKADYFIDFPIHTPGNAAERVEPVEVRLDIGLPERARLGLAVPRAHDLVGEGPVGAAVEMGPAPCGGQTWHEREGGRKEATRGEHKRERRI